MAGVVKRLGARAVIDARRSDTADRLRQLAPDGIEAVLAFAGGDELIVPNIGTSSAAWSCACGTRSMLI
jgi:NADPH-dependent curcumin reductase CurA